MNRTRGALATPFDAEIKAAQGTRNSYYKTMFESKALRGSKSLDPGTQEVALHSAESRNWQA